MLKYMVLVSLIVSITKPEKVIISVGDLDNDLELIPEASRQPVWDLFHKQVTEENPTKPGYWIIKPLENSEKDYPESQFETKKLRRRREPTQELPFKNLQHEYDEKVLQERIANKSFPYSDKGKPEENVKESIDKIAQQKIPVNCSDDNGNQLTAVKCILLEEEKLEILLNNKLTQIMPKVISIWFAVYMIIAVPLWCSKGWCCCCCPFRFCHPGKTIREIQMYIAENPPGAAVDSDGNKEKYPPTEEETNLYEEITGRLLRL